MPEHVDAKTAENPNAPAVPFAPTQPNPAECAPAVHGARRRVVWTCLWGYLGVNFLMFLRYFFPRALFESLAVFTAGYVSDYGWGVDPRYLQSNRCWVGGAPGAFLRA